MQAEKCFRLFEQKVGKNPGFYHRDYLRVKEAVANSTAFYKGKPIDFLYQPMFFAPEDIRRLQDIAENLATILIKVIEHYRREEKFRRLFAFPSLMEELILADPGYSTPFPIARFDLFCHRDANRIKFCELNADGSSGMNEVRELHRIVAASHALDGIGRENFSDFELFDSWIDALLENYRQFSPGSVKDPTIAIVDFTGEGTDSEFAVFCARFRARGYNSLICDPRELDYRGGKLYWQDQQIDLVYRRATTTRIVQRQDEIEDFLRAYREQAVCVVGGFVSQIIHNKQIFAVLHQQQHLPFLTAEEKEFIRKHIPYTAVLNPADQELLQAVTADKDRWVLKPDDQFAAHGVYIGRDCTRQQWLQQVEKAGEGQYLVQEFCQPPQRPMLTVEGETIRFQPYNFMLGLFMYNHKFSGIFTRASRQNVIAAIVESFTLPNFIATGDGSLSHKSPPAD